MKLVVVLVIVLMLFTGFSLIGIHSSVQKNKISIGNFNVQSTNHICSYFPISIKNSPTGTGYYQQLFIFTNPILLNSLNANRSNFYIASSNNTLLYTWIEAYNTTSLTVWSKVPNGTTSVNFEVFPEFDNLLSATGYLGEAPTLSTTYGQYWNANKVFPYAIDFSNLSGWSIASGTPKTTSQGLNLTNSSIYSNNTYDPEVSTANYYLSIPHRTSGSDYSGYFSNRLSTPLISFYYAVSQKWLTQNSSGSNLMSLSPSSNVANFNTYSIWANSNKAFFELNESGTIQSNSTDYSVNTASYLGLISSNINISLIIQYVFLTTNLPDNNMPTYTIELNTYNVNIKSFDKQSNSIHNYFFYNNSVYSANNNTFIFKNKTSFSTISLIPLNFSSYFTEYKNITISQSQFLNNNNNSYYYNLSIYYFNSNLNAVNPYDFANYIYPISILVFLLLGGIILFGTIKYRRSN